MKEIILPMSSSKTQYFINQAYSDYIVGAGFQPMLVAPGMALEQAVEKADALLLPGGIDLHPIYYGEDNVGSYEVDPAKDDFERTLLSFSIDKGIPVFGICRGFQLIIREYLVRRRPDLGKKLAFVQHIDRHNQTNAQVGRDIPSHFVNFAPDVLHGSQSNKIDRIAVNSMHHQGLIAEFSSGKPFKDRGFHIAAWTDRGVKGKDLRLCEAFQITDWGKSKIVAVQWHPEELKDVHLLRTIFDKKAKLIEAKKHVNAG
jgi:putative glutamine amidotransferase